MYEEVVSTMLRKWDRPAFGFKVPNRQLLLLSTLELDGNGILGVEQHGFAKYNVAAADMFQVLFLLLPSYPLVFSDNSIFQRLV